MEMIIIIAIFVIAVLALVWRVIKLSRRNLWQSNKIVELNEVVEKEREFGNSKCSEMHRVIVEKTRIENKLNDLKGEHAKELKKLESENKVLLAKCTFLETCNEEVVRKQQNYKKKGEFVNEVETWLSQVKGLVRYGNMLTTFKCHHSSLTAALANLIKQKKVKRVKQGWYQWVQ